MSKIGELQGKNVCISEQVEPCYSGYIPILEAVLEQDGYTDYVIRSTSSLILFGVLYEDSIQEKALNIYNRDDTLDYLPAVWIMCRGQDVLVMSQEELFFSS